MWRGHIPRWYCKGEKARRAVKETEVSNTSCFFFICFFSSFASFLYSFHLILNITQLDVFTHKEQQSSGFCARVLTISCWDRSSKHPGSDTHKPILSPVTGTKSISIPYLQVVTLPVIGKESPSSYVDRTLMKYWVREDKGFRTVDVAVPGTSTCNGGVV